MKAFEIMKMADELTGSLAVNYDECFMEDVFGFIYIIIEAQSDCGTQTITGFASPA